MRRRTPFKNVCLFFFSLMFVAGCNQTFQPLQKNNIHHFSIYGTLDAAADTQWVRIGPARGDINEPPDPTGIEVTSREALGLMITE